MPQAPAPARPTVPQEHRGSSVRSVSLRSVTGPGRHAGCGDDRPMSRVATRLW